MSQKTKSAAEAAEQTAPQVEITLTDLQVMAQVIAAGSQRGTFRANELAVVGATFNKLMAILEAQNAVPDEVKQSQEDKVQKEEK